MECPFCRVIVKNVQLHFNRKIECGDKIDLDHFLQIFEKYRRQADKQYNKVANEKAQKKKKEANLEEFNLNNLEAVKKAQKKKKEVNLEAFNLSKLEGVEKAQKKKKRANPEAFNLSNLETVKKVQKKKKEAN